ncbi:MAG: hypothetical protein J7J94_01725 [Thaumarchaeota archaeon]|nr:hypothetical protein [Nitrososphaerota archaeon]
MTLEANIAEKLKTVKERVEYLLEHYPEARNDDFYLYILYIRHFEPELSRYIDYVPFNIIKRSTRFESVRRARQKIQEEGHYLPTDPKILRKRRKLAEAYRKVMPKL